MKKQDSEREVNNNVPALTPSDEISPVGEELPANTNGAVVNAHSTDAEQARRVTDVPPTDDADESMTGGYASVKGVRTADRTLWIVVAVMCLMCIVVSVCSALLTAHFMKSGTTPPVISPSADRSDIALVVGSRKPCIAEIDCGGKKGSGIVMKQEGNKIYVLTNEHMISGGVPAVRFYAEDEYYGAEIIGYSSLYDIAVVVVQNHSGYKGYTLDDSAVADVEARNINFNRVLEYSEGDAVVAIGNAVTMGVASYDGIISRAYDLLQYGTKTVPVLRTTAAINAGMSGGALFDMRGRFVGLNTYRMTSWPEGSDGHSDDVEDTGFVTPASIVYPVYKHILRYGNGGEINLPVMTCARDVNSAVGSINFNLTNFGVFTASYRNGKLTVVSLDINLAPRDLAEGDVIRSVGGVKLGTDICRTVGEFLRYRYDGSTDKLEIELESGKKIEIEGYYRVV